MEISVTSSFSTNKWLVHAFLTMALPFFVGFTCRCTLMYTTIFWTHVTHKSALFRLQFFPIWQFITHTFTLLQILFLNNRTRVTFRPIQIGLNAPVSKYNIRIQVLIKSNYFFSPPSSGLWQHACLCVSLTVPFI